ncbi:MAG: hypothetical protein U0903_22295 [Planctomycetales bacterium]
MTQRYSVSHCTSQQSRNPAGLLLQTWKVSLVFLLALTAQNLAQAADDVAAKVQAHLAAGEYGPALTLAQSVTDQKSKAELVQQIVDAQIAAGDFKAAELTSRQETTPAGRGRMRSEIARKREFQGGGSQANYGPLIDLISAHDRWPGHRTLE